MNIKNLIVYRMSDDAISALDDLETVLANRRLKPIQGAQLRTGGFVSPYDGDEEDKPFVVKRPRLVQFRWSTEERIIPPEVVKREVLARIKGAQLTPANLSTAEKKQIKDDVIHDLALKAMSRFTSTDLYIDLKRALLFVGCGSYNRAEEIIAVLRKETGSFPVYPLQPSHLYPTDVMTQWLERSEAESPFVLGEVCELHSSEEEGGAVVKYRNQDLASDEIQEHLNAGKECVLLELKIPDKITFCIRSDYILRNVKLSPSVESDHEADSNDPESQLQATLLMTGFYLGEAFDALEKAFGIAPLDGPLFSAISACIRQGDEEVVINPANHRLTDQAELSQSAKAPH